MSDILAGAGWGLAAGLAVALSVALVVLVALWKRTRQGAPPPDEANVHAHDFSAHPAKRAAF